MSNVRPGVQILIDQLANNPDEFFGPVQDRDSMLVGIRTGKFSSWKAIIEEELIPGARYSQEKAARSYTWFMTDEEKAALAEAYIEARKTRFDAEMITLLMHKLEDPNVPTAFYTTERMRLDASGNLGLGTVHPSTLSNSGYVFHGGQK